MAAFNFTAVRFSTRDVPHGERLSRWREEFGRGIVRVEIEPVATHRPFHAEATLQALPGVRTVRCSGSAAHLYRTRAQAADGDDSVGLVVNLGSRAAVSQCGREAMLDRGDAFPIRTEEAASLTSTHHLGILLPRPALAARLRDLDGAIRVIPRQAQPLRLLLSYLDVVQKNGEVATPELRRSVAGHIHELAALAIGGGRATEAEPLGGVAAARLAAALAHIAERFADPGLTVAVVARRQGISPRYLQRLLEASGTSFTARVNELRLQRALALLSRGPEERTLAPPRRIAHIALDAGFSDVSHFNRLFRVRFGERPSKFWRH